MVHPGNRKLRRDGSTGGVNSRSGLTSVGEQTPEMFAAKYRVTVRRTTSSDKGRRSTAKGHGFLSSLGQICILFLFSI